MSGAVCVGGGCVDFVSRRLLEHVLVEDDKRIHGVTADGGGHLAITRQRDKECLDLLFAMAEGVPPGLHVVGTDMAPDPITVGASGIDGIMRSPYKVAHFVRQAWSIYESPRIESCVEPGESRSQAPPDDNIARGKSA